VQQRAGRVSGPQGKDGIAADPALEAEADAHGARVARGEQIAGGGGAGVSEAVGAEAVQCKKELDRETAATFVWKGGNDWQRIEELKALPAGKHHITIYLDEKSVEWIWNERKHNRLRFTSSNQLCLQDLPQEAVLSYEELHYTSNANGHYYYDDNGTPIAKCRATGALSPPWDDPGWATANEHIAKYLGTPQDEINAKLQRKRDELAEAKREEEERRVREQKNQLTNSLRAKQLRNDAVKEQKSREAHLKKMNANKQAALKIKLDGKAEEGSTTEAPTRELPENSSEEPEAKRVRREDPEDPPGDGGITTN
jgi:hypothetical protein